MNAQVADVQLGLDADQFRAYVVRPALERIDLWSLASENLVLGTGIHESRLRWIDQLAPGPGPAYGPFQMEWPTYGDLWRNFIPGVPGLRGKLLDLAGFDSMEYPPVTELHGNLFFAAGMCRVHYLRVKEVLPAENDAAGMASYWKRYYNTVLGKGTSEQALPSFRVACGWRA